MNTRLRTIAAAAGIALSAASPSSHAQFLAVFNGVASVVTQASGKLGNKLIGGDSAKDIQAERDKFFANFEQQSAGMDAASKVQLRSTMERTWEAAESGLLMANAQAQAAKDAPLIDLKKVASDSVGGLRYGSFMGSLGGTSGLADVLSTATMDGVINGLEGQASPTRSPAITARTATPGLAVSGDVSSALSAGVTSGATRAATGTVTNAVGSAVSGLVGKLGFGSSSEFQATDAVHPLSFFGKHPREVHAKDLYRENGFLGWKRVEASPELRAEAYAPVTGQGASKAAVFNYDKSTGKVIAAFRILTAAPTQFSSVVESYTKMLGVEPRYASTGATLRAVWESGAFVAADASKISAGWSHLVPDVYLAASAVLASGPDKVSRP